MTFYFSHPKEQKLANGASAQSFNCVIECDAGTLASVGWRVSGGKLWPPSVGVGKPPNRRYIDTTLLSADIAYAMVRALRAEGFRVNESDEVAAEYAVLDSRKLDRILPQEEPK